MADITHEQMTVEEFLNLPESNQIIQLIHGEVMMSPAPSDLHQRLVGAIYIFLKQVLPGGALRMAPLDVHIDDAEVVQPDVFWVSEDNDQCVLIEGKYWRGAPDLIIEVLSPSTAQLDQGEKFDLYEKNGVKGYWLVDQALFMQVYRLEDGKFVRQGVFGLDQTFSIQVAGDLEIDVRKLLGQ